MRSHPVAPACRNSFGATLGADMQHASSAALDRLEPLLEELRSLPQLVERKRGVFYRRSRAFLHFHEDPSGMHADVRLGDAFERVRVESESEQKALLERIRLTVSEVSAG